MRLHRNLKKKLFAIGCLSSLIFLVYFNVKTREAFEKLANSNNEYTFSKNFDLETTIFPSFDHETWVFNVPFAQYASKIIVSSRTNQLILETLAFCDYENQNNYFIQSNARFVVYVAHSESKLIYYEISDVKSMLINLKNNRKVRRFWRFRVLMNLDNFKHDLNSVAFAVVDNNKTKENFSKFDSHRDVKYLITYQKPKIYDLEEIDVKKGFLFFFTFNQNKMLKSIF